MSSKLRRQKNDLDCGFFLPKNNVFRTQECLTDEILSQKNNSKQCSGCDQPIGIISTMLYELDEKLYCSECYFRIIFNEALERNKFPVTKKG